MKHKIKILYALESAGGGTLKHVYYLSTCLDPELFEITVVLPCSNYEKETKATISQMYLKGIRIKIIPMSKSIMLKDAYSMCRIYCYLKKHSFDIVHTHSSKAGFLFRLSAWLADIPVILYTPHCFYFTARTGWLRTFYGFSERILARITHGIILSRTENNALQEQIIKPLQEVAIIDNVIDPQEYRQYARLTVRHQFHVPDHHTVVVGVGRLVKQKNWELFIDTARHILSRHLDYTFIIAGEGPHCSTLTKMIEHYQLAPYIRLVGYISDISCIYSVADLFVSTSRWEGLPYTYLEACYFNLPMVIARTQGIEEFCRLTSYAHLVEPIAERLSQMIEDISKSPKFSYTYPFPSVFDFVRKHEDLYLRLLLRNNPE